MTGRGRWAALAWLAVAVGLAPPLAAGLTHGGPWWAGWWLVAAAPAVRQAWLGLAAASAMIAVYVTWFHGAPPEATFGSARWGDPARTPGLASWRAGRAGNPAGLVVGASPARGRVRAGWVVRQDGHVLLAGAPGTGKSTLCLLPTLAVLAEAGAGVVVTDPKGELYAAAGGLFAAAGYTVARLDFRDPARSDGWDALAPVTAALQAGDFAGAARSAREAATLLAAQGAAGGEHSAFFRQSTTALLTALMLLVADRAPPGARHLGSVYRTLIGTPDLDAVFAALPPDHPAALAYGPVRLSGAETRQNQLTVAAAALALWADPGVVALTGRDTVDWARLADGRLAAFVVIPDEASALYGAAALFVQQQLQRLAQAAAARPDQRLVRPVWLVLDEFGNLPALPDFDKTLNVSRGKGIHVVLALQGLAQLAARYGERPAEAMQAGCATWVFLGGNDAATLRAFSERAGQATVRVRSAGRAGATRQDTTSWAARALVTPDEVARWPWGTALVCQMGAQPLRLPLRRYDAWPASWGPGPQQGGAGGGLPTWQPPAAAEAEAFRLMP